jgi:hypothetical protein
VPLPALAALLGTPVEPGIDLGTPVAGLGPGPVDGRPRPGSAPLPGGGDVHVAVVGKLLLWSRWADREMSLSVYYRSHHPALYCRVVEGWRRVA